MPDRNIDFSFDIDKISYKLFGRFFKEKRKKYSDLEKTLRQARIGISYDVYLSKILFLSIISASIGTIVGILIPVFLGGVLPVIYIPFPSLIGSFIEGNLFLSQTILFVLFFSTLFFISTISILYYLPSFYASGRRRRIDITLPHSITFMYALSRGGMNMIEIIRSLSNSEDAYGEVAREFNYILKQMDFFGKDLTSALRHTSSITPSEELSRFLENIVSVIESGGSMENFLLDRSKTSLEAARKEQESMLDTLEVIAESYVAVLVAGPLFVIVIATVIIAVQSIGFLIINLIVYIIIPFVSILFIVLIDTITIDEEPNKQIFELENTENKEKITNEKRQYIKDKPREKLKNLPTLLRENPYLSLIFTVPLSLILFLLLFFSGTINISIDSFQTRPVWTTSFVFIAPLFILIAPISFFHEIKMRRWKKASRELPEILKNIESANNMGVPLKETFALVAEENEGVLSKQLGLVSNEVEWHGNLSRGLRNFANRLQIPRISRTMNLLAEANRVTGQIGRVIEIAAEDAEESYKLRKERSRNIFIYVLIIIISFLVFLFVISILKITFLEQISQVENTGNQAGGSLFGFSSSVIVQFNVLFFHASIIQAFFTGILAGVMSEGRVTSGLKYTIALILLTIGVFSFI